MIEYQDKTILITGASSGIGESLAIKLDKLGANLILTARSKDKLDKLALKMNNAIVVAGDLSDRDFPPNLYDEIVSKNIEIDILINNAGFGYSGLFLDCYYLRLLEYFSILQSIKSMYLFLLQQ